MFLLPAAVFPASAPAADVIITGDVQYRPVSEVASGVKRSLQSRAKIYDLSEIKGRLASVVSREGARVVVALGKDAVDEAVGLPASIAVIYGLVIEPPKRHRHNMTGVYMSTPVSEYVGVIRKHLPSIKKISVVGSNGLLNTLGAGSHSRVTVYRVGSSADFVKTLGRMGDTQALLLLPDVSMLSTAVMDNVYLFCFRRGIPLFGISEGNVKHGALMALVFDPSGISEQIAELADSALQGADIADVKPAAPKKYRLSLNINTAKKMGITIPEGLLRNADKIYE
jgi:putative tryptophan/tyrosine transport system substrate-binding protein